VTDLPPLDELDPSGALLETAEKAGFGTRLGFLSKLGAIVGGAVLFRGLAEPAEAEAKAGDDIGLLNFALVLEYLTTRFYEAAAKGGALKSPQAQSFAQIAAAHEKAHLVAILKPLGRQAVKEPKFNFRDTTQDERKFRVTAQGIEDISVHVWLGQHARFKGPFRRTADTILTVEARHCAWIRALNGGLGQRIPAPAPFDVGWNVKQIKAAITPTGFFVGGFPDVP
jgi:hypothetical protein